MSQFRRDPLNGGWVIIATERGNRPSDFGSVRNERKPGPCVFCAGQEHQTPPEVQALRSKASRPNASDWSIRVVPNKYAAVEPCERLHSRQAGLFAELDGLGVHEVVIETPEHDAHLCDLPHHHVKAVLRTYQDRLRAMMDDERILYVQIFKNWGTIAGASQEHSHSQIIGLPIVPRFVKEQLEAAKIHRTATGRCLVCDIVEQELREGTRLVAENDHFIALAPFASRFPFETHIYPRNHRSAFLETNDEELSALAYSLKEVLFALRIALLDPPFNFIIHARPRVDEVKKDSPGGMNERFHWHIEIIPRLTQVAGFEWGTGFYINPTPPEQAAQFLRDVLLPSDAFDQKFRSSRFPG